MKPASVWAIVLAAGILGSGATETEAQIAELVVARGDPPPDGNGTFFNVRDALLNDAGIVAFTGNFIDTGVNDDAGLYLTDGLGGLIQVQRTGDPPPTGSGLFFGAGVSPALNEAAQIAFRGAIDLFNGGGNIDERGLFLGDGVSALEHIVRHGDPAPDGNGVFSSDTPNTFTFNDAGQTAFDAFIDLQDGGSMFDESAIYRGDGPGALVRIARAGDASPDGNGTFSVLSTPRLNATGLVAFTAELVGTTGGTIDDCGVYVGDGLPGGLVPVVRDGQAAPDGNGVFSFVSTDMFNDAGQVLLGGVLTGTTGGVDDDRGVFLSDANNGPVQLAREGEAGPDGNGVFASFPASVLNNNGQVMFLANLTGTSAGIFDDSGLFLSDGGPGTLSQIVLEGGPAPDGNGVFSNFTRPAFNDAGQAAFVANLRSTSGGSNDNQGLYFYDPALGIIQVVREGDPLLGSTVANVLNFANGEGLGDEFSGLNEGGQLTYHVILADGNEAIYRWTAIPEPASLVLLSLGAVAIGARRGQIWRRSRAQQIS